MSIRLTITLDGMGKLNRESDYQSGVIMDGSKTLEIVMTIILMLFALYLGSWLYRIIRFQFTEK
jgi:hypothetical protein